MHYVEMAESRRSETSSLRRVASRSTLDPDIQAILDRCQIPYENLQLGIRIGKGNFGLVFKGRLQTQDGKAKTVAIKTLRDDLTNDFRALESFLAEGTLMKDFKHQNVLSLIGVAFDDDGKPQVVLPYMDNGDLCTFIKQAEVKLVFADLLHFGLQIANGMAYLASERFVHRDLAARNCLVSRNCFIKIADFGLSRNVYERDYYKMDNMDKPLPIRWMAIECLREGRFTSNSDVWAYGITLWELLTRGSTPYPDLQNHQIKNYIKSGQRLEKPNSCNMFIYELMCQCWRELADDRPTFQDIAESLCNILSKDQKSSLEAEGDESGYVRQATVHISDDYLNQDECFFDEDYLTPEVAEAQQSSYANVYSQP